MTVTSPPTCWIIAGPNGAGKTTFALRYLPAVANCRNFVNADLIAAGLSPLEPERELIAASRLFLREIKNHIQRRETFAFETTLAGRSYLKLIHTLRKDGWTVELIYLALPSVAISRQRVAERVAHGGHNIPLRDIERRFSRSLGNLLNDFSFAVTLTQCFMNTGDTPELVFIQEGRQRSIANEILFNQLAQQAIQ